MDGDDIESTLSPLKSRRRTSELGWRLFAMVVGCIAGIGFALWATHF